MKFWYVPSPESLQTHVVADGLCGSVVPRPISRQCDLPCPLRLFHALTQTQAILTPAHGCMRILPHLYGRVVSPRAGIDLTLYEDPECTALAFAVHAENTTTQCVSVVHAGLGMAWATGDAMVSTQVDAPPAPAAAPQVEDVSTAAVRRVAQEYVSSSLRGGDHQQQSVPAASDRYAGGESESELESELTARQLATSR